MLEGARNIYYAEIADPSVAVLSQSVIWDARGISKMFGLIGACLAMYQTARPENREKIKPVLITAAVTSFIAGVTEPSSSASCSWLPSCLWSMPFWLVPALWS